MDIRLPIFIETWKNRERMYSMKICRRTNGSPIDKRELYLKGDKKEWGLLDERTCEVGTIRPEFLVISFFNENDHKQISYILAFPKNFLMGDVQANKCKKKTRKGGKKKKRKAEVFELFPALQACSAISKFTTNTSEESEVQITIQDVSRQRHPILISLCTISFVVLSGGSLHYER